MEYIDFEIDKYSHYFRVLPVSAMARRAVVDYMSTLIEHTLTKKRGRWSMTPDCVYAAKDVTRGRYHLHINGYEDFLLHLEKYRINMDTIEVTEHKLYKPVKVDIKLLPKWIARETQRPVIQYCTTAEIQAAVTAQTGGGKAQTLDSLLRIPGGWKRMGDIAVGDDVISRDGTPTKVTGVFPQGLTKVYRVTFADGRYVDVNPEHLWSIRIIHTEGEQVVTTEDIRRRLALNNSRAKKITVPLIEPEEGTYVPHSLDPYLLGVILGDGNISHVGVTVSKPDTELRELVTATLPVTAAVSEHPSTDGMSFGIVCADGVGRNPVAAALRGFGLMGTVSETKFIPQEYLEGTREQRLALVQGLLDTDGTVNDRGTVSFSSTSKSLAEGMQYLIRSLGGIAKITTRIPKYRYNDKVQFGKTDYRVHIRYPRPNELFRLTRKRELARDTQYTERLRLRIVSVEPQVMQETQCIMVDHPEHLYVTNDFTVTHNTFMLMAAAAARGERFGVRAPGGMSSQWEKAFIDYLGLKKEDGDYVMCNGAKALRKLIKEIRTTDKHKNLKAVFISNGAIRDLIKFMDTPEHDGECGGLFHPANLYETLGLGLIGVDEAHKEMHSNFVADLYTHCPLRIALTATLIPRDAFSAKKYELYLPQRTRRDLGALRIYVDLTEVLYNLAKPDKFRRVIKQSVYSHNEFERTIMQDKETLNRYMDALYKYVVNTWLGERVYETKAIFYCGLVDMGTVFTQYFAKRLPDMRVVQYNAGDPYDVLLDNDMIFSTAIKAGTAVDIPDLSRVYNAISIDSPNTLVQILGRLRYHEHLEADGFHFHQFCCLDIPKQMGYKTNRKTLLTPRVKSIREVPLGKLI